MKKILSFLLVIVLLFSMSSCAELLNEFKDFIESTNDSDNDGYNDDIDLNPDEAYRVPIILLHGRVSNTAVFFGVNTGIEEDDNDYYGTEYEELYTNPDNHEIVSIEDGRLGKYLVDCLGYEQNKNLFAFNYPNEDMVKMNAKRFSQYVKNLVDAGSKGEESTSNFVDSSALFATKEDQKNGRVKFILIGHSMGGLVSRYYIENISDRYVEKLITICTPHYGSELAKWSDGVDLETEDLDFKPCDVDLRKDSHLFGGEKKKKPGSFDHLDEEDEEYAYLNQSSPLNGNDSTNVKYYAIGGYDTDSGDDLADELEKLLENGGAFSFSFDILGSHQTKQKFKDDINEALTSKSISVYGKDSKLDLGNLDGDNVVDYMSQFAVRFDSDGKIDEYQTIMNATLILSSKKGLFHNEIANESLMHEAVKEYIEAETDEVNDDTDAGIELDKWTSIDAIYVKNQKCVVLTQDYKKWQCGSIWYNDPLTDDFVVELEYYTGSADRSYGGADGIVVAFYANKEYKQQSGLDIGFTGCQGYGIELDTYYNKDRNDPSKSNHIALVKERVANHIAYSELPESEDEQWHRLKIVVKDGVCEAYVDGILKISTTIEKTGYNWLGITAATGEGHNLHAVRNVVVINNG